MRYERCLVVATVLVSGYLSGSAQAQVCVLSDTIDGCRDKVAQDLAQASREGLVDEVEAHQVAQKKATENDLQVMNTGNSPASAAGASNTANDFISALKVSADSGGVSEGKEELTFELNQFLGLPAEAEAGYKLDATVHQAAVFDPLSNSLLTGGETALLEELKNGLGDGDDVTVAFTYSPMTETLGRSDHLLHADIFEQLFTAAQTITSRQLPDTANALSDLESQLGDSIEQRRAAGRTCPMSSPNDPTSSPLLVQGLTFQQLSDCLDDIARVTEYMRLFEADAAGELRNVLALQAELRKNQFFHFADLVSNQPQVYVRAGVRSRDDAVGPSETSLKLAYEKGWVNVNTYREFRESACSSLEEYSCLTNYLTPDRIATMERGDRIAVALEYSKVDRYAFQPRANLPVLEAPGAHSLIASVAYGRYLQFGRGEAHSRVDLALSYDDVSDDQTRQDRGLLNITYSQRVSDTFVLALTVVYANKPEFLGAADKEIGVNLGLNYKLLRDSEF